MTATNPKLPPVATLAQQTSLNPPKRSAPITNWAKAPGAGQNTLPKIIAGKLPADALKNK